MTDLDKLVSSDLSALATASRQHLLGLADLRVFRAPAPVPVTRPAMDLLGPLYAARLGRLAAGAIAVALVLARLAINWVDADKDSFVQQMSPLGLLGYIGSLALTTRVVVANFAARHLAPRADRWTTASTVATLGGGAAVAILIGASAVLNGPVGIWAEHPVPLHIAAGLTLAIAGALGGALLLARARPGARDRIAADQIGRIAGGTIAVALVVARLTTRWLDDLSLLFTLNYVIAIALAVRLVVANLAARWRGAADRWDRAATTATLAGTSAVTILFGAVMFIVGPRRAWTDLVDEWLPGFDAARVSLHNLTGAVVVVLVAAVGVGLTTPRALEDKRVSLTAVAVLITTCVVGMQLDVGPLIANFMSSEEPSNPLRIALLAVGGTSTFLIIAGSVLRGRRAELARRSC